MGSADPGTRGEPLHESGSGAGAYVSTDGPAAGAGGYPQPGYAAQGPYPPQGMYASSGPYPPQGQYGPPQSYQQHDGGSGPGFGDRASQAASSFGRHIKTPETKEFFKTSE